MTDGSLADSLPGTEQEHNPVTMSPCHVVTLSRRRAWWYLVRLCLQRQSRSHQMVWIALILMAFTATVVVMNTAAGRWGMAEWRFPRRVGPTFEQYVSSYQKAQLILPWNSPAAATQVALLNATRFVLDESGFFVFTNWIVYSVFLSFLLPIWSLSFATEALGGEREAGTLIWLLTRPLPRWSIYLAKYVALLPWGLGLNLGGFAVLCLAAGRPGTLALERFWPAVLLGSLAFCSLFHLLGACFRRAAVVGLVYSFFLEIILGNMPGLMKRVSIGFYARCMMFERAQSIGVQPPKSTEYLAVDTSTALWALLAISTASLLIGMVVFARTEYQDLA
jgi:ABC-2 type transport system permease protein